ERFQHRPAVITQVGIDAAQAFAPLWPDFRGHTLDQDALVVVMKIPGRPRRRWRIRGQETRKAEMRVRAFGGVAKILEQFELDFDVRPRSGPADVASHERLEGV